MNDDILEHHRLEDELWRLRQLRAARDPGFTAEKEDAILDQMEAVWNRLSVEGRRTLEAERKSRQPEIR